MESPRGGGAQTHRQEPPPGFPDPTVTIADMFSAHDKIVTRLVGYGTHTSSYGTIKAAGKLEEARYFAVWPADSKVTNSPMIQD